MEGRSLELVAPTHRTVAHKMSTVMIVWICLIEGHVVGKIGPITRNNIDSDRAPGQNIGPCRSVDWIRIRGLEKGKYIPHHLRLRACKTP